MYLHGLYHAKPQNTWYLPHFWKIWAKLGLFGPPQRGWDLWFSLRSCVRPSVCSSVRSAENSKSVHRNFLIFGTKLGLPNAMEVTFSDFARKIPFGRFWTILVKKWPFSAKNQGCPFGFFDGGHLRILMGGAPLRDVFIVKSSVLRGFSRKIERNI